MSSTITLTKEELREDPLKHVLAIAGQASRRILGRKSKEGVVVAYGFIMSQFMNAQNIGYKTEDPISGKTILEVAADWAFAGIDVKESAGKEIFNFITVISAVNAAAYIATKSPETVTPEEEYASIKITMELGESPVIEVINI